MSKFNRFASFALALVILAPAMALAEGTGATASGWGNEGLIAIATALTMGAGAAFGTLSQSRAATAALEGIARNPSAAGDIRGTMILGLALIESLVLFAFVIAFLLQNKIG